jgi:hypothetical protein
MGLTKREGGTEGGKEEAKLGFGGFRREEKKKQPISTMRTDGRTDEETDILWSETDVRGCGGRHTHRGSHNMNLTRSLVSERPKVVLTEISADILAKILAMPAETESEKAVFEIFEFCLTNNSKNTSTNLRNFGNAC